MAVEGLAHEPFALVVADLHGGGDGPGEFDEVLIEQGDAAFQTDAHGGAIDLC